MAGRCVAELHVGVVGASSLVGHSVVSRLQAAGVRVTAFSRAPSFSSDGGVHWQRVGAAPVAGEEIARWICVAPIWVLPDYFAWLRRHGVRRLVAVSSTSRFTKTDSSDAQEQAVAERLIRAEEELAQWAQARGVVWTVLRPTLIYGEGRDQNIAAMARFICRFGFFPVRGQARGLRQPVHADDVAAACVAALSSAAAANRAYNLVGGETLSYRDMAARVFAALGRPPRLVPVPLWLFRLTLLFVRLLPRFRHWTPAMAERMNRDLVFDGNDAVRDLGVRPRAFTLRAVDVRRSA